MMLENFLQFDSDTSHLVETFSPLECNIPYYPDFSGRTVRKNTVFKQDYLDNITTECVFYRRKIAGPKVKKLTGSKLDHLLKLLEYKERAFHGKRKRVFK